MAGFEVVVRPVVFPNIRPASPRVLLPEDASEQGIAVINGSDGKLIDLSASEQSSWTRTHLVEAKRRYDKVRVPYSRPDGSIDWSRYTEFEVIKEVDFFEGNKHTRHRYADFKEPPDGSALIIEKDMVRKNSGA
jgi:hypothetical protein